MHRLFTLALLAPLGLAVQEAAPARPHLLWISCEDISPNLGCYGDAYATTPNLDKLATQGVRYTQAFAPVGVCAPARSSLILGAYACSIGTQHMRCKGTLPGYVKCFPEYLREAGYYCTNNSKTDYNFDAPKSAWDESSSKGHWRNRKPGQPFFSVMNLTTCHESQIRIADSLHEKRMQELAPIPAHDPAKAAIPPYHPDVPEVRRDWARYADSITYMDMQAGRILADLEKDGLASDTIVVFFSDHGAGMPRSKRWLYDSSLRVPLIVRVPEKWKAWAPGPPGGVSDRLVTFVDFGPSMLSLAGLKIPPHMQGTPFLGAAAGAPREYVHGFRDRMDERTDLLRCVRDRKWKYIRNYRPDVGWAQHIGYMYEMPTMKVWQRLHDAGKLDAVQARFFASRKPAEELYDTEADPWEVRNLADDPEHRETLRRLRTELRRWQLEIRDAGMLPEADLRLRFGAAPVHEAVRKDPAVYPLERILDAADAAAGAGSMPPGLLEDPDPAVRFWGVIGTILREEPPALLRALLADPAPSVRLAAARAFGRRGDYGTALPVLAEGLGHGSAWVRLQAAQALDELGPQHRPAWEMLRERSKDETEYLRRIVDHAVSALGK